MRRMFCLGIVTAAGVLATAAANVAQEPAEEPRANLVLHEVGAPTSTCSPTTLPSRECAAAATRPCF